MKKKELKKGSKFSDRINGRVEIIRKNKSRILAKAKNAYVVGDISKGQIENGSLSFDRRKEAESYYTYTVKRRNKK